jgi:alkylated DNA repair dioxygenase AlkB
MPAGLLTGSSALGSSALDHDICNAGIIGNVSISNDHAAMLAHQFTLFPHLSSTLPEGLAYCPDVISNDEERRLLAEIATLPFREFQFHGFEGKRRVVSFGWRYDFSQHKALPADPIPALLREICRKVQAASGFVLSDLQQVLISEYSPGAPIGWHKDRPVFGNVMGLSLASPCTFRLRRADGEGKWRRVALRLEPRSAYLLAGPARWTWEHSIPPVEALRYSITFRNRRSEMPPSVLDLTKRTIA